MLFTLIYRDMITHDQWIQVHEKGEDLTVVFNEDDDPGPIHNSLDLVPNSPVSEIIFTLRNVPLAHPTAYRLNADDCHE